LLAGRDYKFLIVCNNLRRTCFGFDVSLGFRKRFDGQFGALHRSHRRRCTNFKQIIASQWCIDFMTRFTGVHQQRYARCSALLCVLLQFDVGAGFNNGALTIKVFNTRCTRARGQPIARGQ
jgi:hypothetical protein